MDNTSKLVRSLQQAVTHHKIGRFQEAERLYLAILQADPLHPEANHNMGALLVQMQHPEAALPFLLAALEADQARGQYWISYIDALYRAGHRADAMQVLDLAQQQGLQGAEVDALAERVQTDNQPVSAVSGESSSESITPQTEPLVEVPRQTSPTHLEIDALVSLFNAGQLAQAESVAQSMTLRYPGHEFGWKALGAVYKQMGMSQDALAPMQKAAQLSPADVEAHYNLGVALQELGRMDEAEAAYRHALSICPDYAEASCNLGVVLQKMDRLEEAELRYRRAVDIRPDYVQAYRNLGNVLNALGKHDDAQTNYRAALQLDAGDADVHFELGNTLFESGREDEARDCYRRVNQINPAYAASLCDLGNQLMGAARISDAQACYQKAIRVDPDYAMAHGNLGVVFKEQGRLEDARESLRRALEINPDYVQAHNNLGVVLREMGRLDEACECLSAALLINPDFADAHSNLGLCLHDMGDPEEACECFQRALLSCPDSADIYNNLGNTLKELDRFEEARACYLRAIQLRPDFAKAHGNLGILLMGSKEDCFDAEASFRRALHLDPDYADAHSSLGVVLHALGRRDEAVDSFRRALLINPGLAEAHNNLGNSLRDFARLDEAVSCYRRALELDPSYAMAHSNMIFTLDMAADISIEAMQAERRKWGEMHEIFPRQLHDNVRDPVRRLRIGYVSADFRTTSAPTVYAAMLLDYDRAGFDVYCYANEAEETELTRSFQQNVSAWRNIYRKSDDEVVRMIRQDRIDILVDLSGHSRDNRLPVFARKPAPIQITAWGYSTGTGMSSMDVLFSDAILIPPDERPLYAEQVIYLPNFLSYCPSLVPPDFGALPALTNEYITFGSFSRLERVSDEAFQVWAEVLLAVPESRMLLKNSELNHPEARARVTGKFTRAGVAAERLILLGGSRWEDHMAVFNQVDIALDTFPQGGGVTTLEGILMGVPLITLRRPTFAGRTGASFLTTLNLDDWIAHTPAQYVQIAMQKAQDVAGLARLRGQLRHHLMNSALGNGGAYAGLVEVEYRRLWRNWCDARDVSAV